MQWDVEQVVLLFPSVFLLPIITMGASPQACCYPSAASFHSTFWNKNGHTTISFTWDMKVKLLTTDFTVKWMRKVHIIFYTDSSTLSQQSAGPNWHIYQIQKEGICLPPTLSLFFISSVDTPAWKKNLRELKHISSSSFWWAKVDLIYTSST